MVDDPCTKQAPESMMAFSMYTLLIGLYIQWAFEHASYSLCASRVVFFWFRATL